MANIYKEKTEELHQLLDRARSADGATVLIPDLQRPYVWTPNQVSLLVDSLIRGWPFGTLLMWKVGQSDIQNIPHRQFWRVVDRTSDAASSVVTRKDPPAAYHMVLDGQQRVQSLLLALGGDAWGFKMEDRAWAQEVQDRRPRGRYGKYRHWSKASLCFDLDRFLREYDSSGDLLTIDFRTVLQWVITDPSDGQSKWTKPATYEEPLARAFADANKGRLVRMSRLWSSATPNPNIKEGQFRDILQRLLKSEGIPDAKVEQLLIPMGELMTTLRDVKLSEVTYLELVAFDGNIWTEDAYNDAIVNIFARLNTAGRTLSREEITLAWLKVGWDPNATGGRTAGECFEDLLVELADRGLDIKMDDLVAAVSFIWSVLCNGGQILANRDLLKGATIRPMASDLARRWKGISHAIIGALDVVASRGLEFGGAGQYSSLNALAVVWAWRYIAADWEDRHQLAVPQRDGLQKSIDAALSARVDRWLICSQWAGRWSGSSPAMGGYAKALNDEFLACEKVGTVAELHEALARRLNGFVVDLEPDAANYIASLAASSRERVATYRTALWVWHRLDATRWLMSATPLRLGKRKANLDVDHAVAFALWETKLKTEPPSHVDDEADPVHVVNMLGNCSLLEKAFNISKGRHTLAWFMNQVHEVKQGEVSLSSWAKALGLDSVMLDPESSPTDGVISAIASRDASIRADLTEFVKGMKVRTDV